MTEENRRLGGAAALGRLASPRSVAIVGGSADPGKISGRPVKFLRQYGYRGPAYLVNPGRPRVDGYESVARVRELPGPPDAAFVALPAGAATDAIGELAAIGTPVAIVLASGYGESGVEGIARQRELVAAAGTTRLLGPNSLGLVNMTGGVVLTPSDALESPGLQCGPVGFASQSGGIMASLLSRAGSRGLAYSTLISTGNEADLEISDCIEHLVGDEATEVIACYLETVRDPTRFGEAAHAAASAGKRVVCFKVGRSEVGARAAISHTGAIAGSDRAFDALLEQAGVIRVRRFSELLDVPAALAGRRPMTGRRVGVLTTTGGAGTLLADACGAVGLDLPLPRPQLAERLAATAPGVALGLDHNPIDLTLAGTRPEVMGPMIDCLGACDDFDALVVVIGSSGVRQPRLVADPLITCAQRDANKPIFAYASPHLPEVIARLNRAGVPAFDSPEDCASALAALVSGAAASPVAPPAARGARDGRLLNEHDGKELLARFGIASPRRVIATTSGEVATKAGALREPLVIKILSSALPHKSKVGGVRVGLSALEATRAASDMLAKLGGQPELLVEGLLVEEMHFGVELLIGMIRDPVVGPTLVLGAGGGGAEYRDDSVVALLPVDDRGAAEMIGRLRIAPLLDSHSGQSAVDRQPVVRAIVAFSRLVEELGDALVEAEINPLMVLDEPEEALALDVLIRLAE